MGTPRRKIATEFAGCPLCSRDLIEANGTKPVVRYPNGFVTFRTLAVGEVLNLPDKWFSGYLDTLPQSYFDGLPQMPTRAPISEGTKSSLAGHGVGQNVSPANVVQSCVAWALGGWNPRGSDRVPSDQPERSAGRVRAGRELHAHRAVRDGDRRQTLPLQACDRAADRDARGPSDGANLLLHPAAAARATELHERPAFVGVQRWSQADAGTHGRGRESAPGAGSNRSPRVDAPASVLPAVHARRGVLAHGLANPAGWLINPDPTSILNNLGFEVTFLAPNGDGSWTANVIYTGATPYQIDANAGRSAVVFSGGNHFGQNYVIGETVVGSVTGTQATVTAEYDTSPASVGFGVLSLSGATGYFAQGEVIKGVTSNAVPRALYQYTQVMVSPKSGAMLGLTSVNNQGSSFQLPYVIQPGDQASMTVRPTTDQNSDMSDPVSILVALGFAGSDITLGAQNPDCTWPVQVKSSATTAITIDEQPADPSTGALMWVTALTVNGNVILAPTPPPPPIAPPTMSACHAFTLTFIQNQCAAINGGPFDPTDGLSAMGLTKFTLSPVSGPDAQGQWSVNGVWELGDGFVLPASKKITITQFQDNGPSVNVAGGPCGIGAAVHDSTRRLDQRDRAADGRPRSADDQPRRAPHDARLPERVLGIALLGLHVAAGHGRLAGPSVAAESPIP